MINRVGSWAGTACVAACLGCVGSLDTQAGDPSAAEGGGPPGTASLRCRTAGPSAGTTRLRRLTRQQYYNTVLDLLKVDAKAAVDLPADERVGIFYANTSAPVDERTVQRYLDGAERIAALAVAKLKDILPCDPAKVGDDACADRFTADFVRRAYRRPPTAGELDAFKAVYLTGKKRDGLRSGIELVIRAGLAAPHFLYQVEEGSAAAGGSALEALDGFSLAARLSYFLWGSMPDEALFDAARSGALDSPGGLHAQALRLLDDPRARTAVVEFHRQWLDLDGLATVEKSGTLFPGFAALREPMRLETEAFVDHVVRKKGGSLATLLTAPYSFPDAALAKLYGVALPAGRDPASPVPLDPGQRAGVLTQASVLAAHSNADQASPIRRGLFVFKLMCRTIPPPPAGMMVQPPKIDRTATTRERFAQHRASPACASCHDLLDPVGFSFGHYDAIGAWRDTELSLPIDASGQLSGTDSDGRFDGAVALAARLAGSDQLRACVARQWFRFALARAEQEDDQCSLHALDDSFAKSGFNIRDLMAALATTDAFRYRAGEAKDANSAREAN